MMPTNLQVSDAGVNYVQRTAEECEIRWLGDRHPEYNHSAWSLDETERAMELMGDAKEGEIDWVDLATKLGVRWAVPCSFVRYLTSFVFIRQTVHPSTACVI